jgi:Tol biopolymer transport system component
LEVPVARDEGNGFSAYSVSREGTLVYLPPGEQLQPSGRLLIFDATRGDAVVMDIAQGDRQRVRLPANTDSLSWMSNGRLFWSGGDGAPNLWSIDPDGRAAPVRLTNSVQYQNAFDGSRDLLVYGQENAGTMSDLMALEGSQPHLLEKTPAFESQARISPDGQLFAYAAIDATGSQIWIRALDTPGVRRQVTADGGRGPTATFCTFAEVGS